MVFWNIFLGSFIMGFSGAMMPGPLLTVTIDESLRKGAKAGPFIVLGHAVLELTLVILIIIGLGTIITSPLVKGLIGIVGGIFLLWMAYGILREAANKDLALHLEGEVSPRRLNPVVAGITISAANPYWSIWWATAGAGSLILAGTSGLAGVASFFFGHILADLTWYSIVSFAVAKGRKVFTPLIYRILLGLCGVFLIGLALYFTYSGVNFFGG